MKIAVTTWSSRRVGGVETYLSDVLPALSREGHELALFHETDGPTSAERVVAEGALPAWSADRLGPPGVMRVLVEWKPDVIYAHGAEDPAFDLESGKVAPVVFFVHNYYGTCVGGMKTFTYPTVKPCGRAFGWGCLVHYYPRRCGGLNPVTMASRYALQARRLKVVKGCEAVVTHSHHMYCEFAKNGVPPDRLHRFPYYAAGRTNGDDARALPVLTEDGPGAAKGGAANGPIRVTFSGRFDRLKGGGVLLDALPQVAGPLGRSIDVTFAGDGPARAEWEARAGKVGAGSDRIKTQFTGWLDRAELEALVAGSDLVVVPSVWPEPFGLVGPEAGRLGVPVAAFAVGGVRDWLVDGVNGHLAPGDPPTADGLAVAMLRCLRDPDAHARLRRGAIEMARRFNRQDHLRELQNVLESVRRSR